MALCPRPAPRSTSRAPGAARHGPSSPTSACGHSAPSVPSVRTSGTPSGLAMTETRFRQAFLLLLVAAISAAFVAMIRVFLLTIVLAAIFTGVSYPVYQWLLGRLRWPSGAGGDRDARAVARRS